MRNKILLSLLLASLPLSTQAMQFMAGEDVKLTEKISDDLYVSGGFIEIDADIEGDLVISGGEVQINGNVNGDVLAFGGDITLNGTISDDLKIAGGQAEINGIIKDDVLGAGGTINFGKKSIVEGSANLVSGYSKISGQIQEDLNIKGGTIIFEGQIQGNSNLEAQNILFREPAKIVGNLTYSISPENPNLNKFVLGQTVYSFQESSLNLASLWENFSLREEARNLLDLIGTGFAVISLVNVFLLGLVFWLFSPRLLHLPAETLLQKPAVSFAFGMGFFFFVPWFIFIGFFTLVLFVPALISGSLWLLVAYFSKIVTAGFLGNLILPIKNPLQEKGMVLASFALGLVFYQVISSLYVIGFIFVLLSLICGSGAILLAIHDVCIKIRKHKIL